MHIEEEKNAYCFYWNEVNYKRGSTEIGSILWKYILKLNDNVTHVTLFSDTCGGQNNGGKPAHFSNTFVRSYLFTPGSDDRTKILRK